MTAAYPVTVWTVFNDNATNFVIKFSDATCVNPSSIDFTRPAGRPKPYVHVYCLRTNGMRIQVGMRRSAAADYGQMLASVV